MIHFEFIKYGSYLSNPNIGKRREKEGLFVVYLTHDNYLSGFTSPWFLEHRNETHCAGGIVKLKNEMQDKY